MKEIKPPEKMSKRELKIYKIGLNNGLINGAKWMLVSMILRETIMCLGCKNFMAKKCPRTKKKVKET